MLTFLKWQVPVLPVHDSFIIAASESEQLQKEMKRIFEVFVQSPTQLTVSTPPGEVENAPGIAGVTPTPEHTATYSSYYDRAQHWLPRAKALPDGRAIWDALNKKRRKTGT